MPDWILPSPDQIRANGGFTNPEGRWISSEMHFGEVAPAPEVPPSQRNN